MLQGDTPYPVIGPEAESVGATRRSERRDDRGLGRGRWRFSFGQVKSIAGLAPGRGRVDDDT